MKTTTISKWDKYISVVMKLDNRYRVNGRLVIDTGGMPSRYSLLEDMAGLKYLGLKRRYKEGL